MENSARLIGKPSWAGEGGERMFLVQQLEHRLLSRPQPVR
jgi:hypothetical protein